MTDLESMRLAGKLAARLLNYIEPFVQVGVTTIELNDLCHQFHLDNNAVPAPLNYKGFPKSVCTSVNHVVCHGVPSDKRLRDGDIINIDVTPILDGWHGDTSRTFFVGKPPRKAELLVEAAYSATMFGIEQVKPGATVGDIGKAIQERADKGRYSCVEEYCGHGIGKVFHTHPQITGFDSGDETLIEEGMFFTVEPMLTIGKAETKVLADRWTVVTKDRSLSAQFEHTIYVTHNGYEILTVSS